MQYPELIQKIQLEYYIGFFGSIIISVVLIGSGIFLLKRIFFRPKGDGKIQINQMISIFLLIGLVFALFLFVSGFFGYLHDFDNVQNNIYIEDVCVVIGPSSAGNSETLQDRSPLCESEINGDEFLFSTFYTPMLVGEKYRVLYLPHTKIGRVIEKLE